MNPSQNIVEAVELLSAGGVLAGLKQQATAERESERAGLLAQLAEVEAADAVVAAKSADEIAAATAKVQKLEAQLAAARDALNALSGQHGALGVRAQKIRGKLRKLADPAIAEADRQLQSLHEKARLAFGGRSMPSKTFNGVKQIAINNSLDVAEVLSEITRARQSLVDLQESARPVDLDAALAGLLEPLHLAVRKLHGFQ